MSRSEATEAGSRATRRPKSPTNSPKVHLTPIEIAALLRIRPPLSVSRVKALRHAGVIRESDLFEAFRLLLREVMTPDEARQLLAEGRLP